MENNNTNHNRTVSGQVDDSQLRGCSAMRVVGLYLLGVCDH